MTAPAQQVLMASLAALFQALQAPGYSQQLGPSVPGATSPGGSRVPGTSFELQPTEVAERLHRFLGDAAGLLAEADCRARRAVREGQDPPTMRDVFAAMNVLSTQASDCKETLSRYQAAVAGLYPTKQQPLVQALFTDPARLDAMPVQQFMAVLVRNG